MQGTLDVPALHFQVLAMVLVAFERVELQPLQRTRRTVEQAAAFGDLLQKQRVGAIEQGEIHLALGKERLQVLQQLRVRRQRPGWAFEQDGQVDVAARVHPPGYG